MKEFDRKKELTRYWIWTLIGLSVIVCLEWNRVNFASLFDADGQRNALSILSGLAKPDLSPDFLVRIFKLSIESLLVGLLGTVFAVIIGTSLALVAMRVPQLPDPPESRFHLFFPLAITIRWSARFLLGFFRSVPEVVWAYLFVRMLGLGPGAAVLAIGLTVGGSIGKLYAELGEATDRQIISGFRSSGAGRLATILFGVIPQVSRQWVAYALFRMECNIRTGTILGVVGAGGLGTEIALSIRYFEFDKLATTLIAVLLFVISLELLSAWLRQKSMRIALAFGGVGGLVSFFALDVAWLDLFKEAQLLPPIGDFDLSSEFLLNTVKLIFETVSMAWIATMVAALLAFFLAPLATRHLVTSSYLSESYSYKGFSKILRTALLWSSRMGLQITRAMPELTLALIFVVWVGPGAFAGILAIAVHNIGVIGRLYTDVYEEVEKGPVRALQSSGVGSLGVWLYGIIPQVYPRLAAFTLYRFEVNVRATAMVGFVGAGGIGDALHTSISLFQTADLLVLLMVMLLVVTVIDNIGDSVRHKILTRTSTPVKRSSIFSLLIGKKKHRGSTSYPTETFPHDTVLAYTQPSSKNLFSAQIIDLKNNEIKITSHNTCPKSLLLDIHLKCGDEVLTESAKVISSIANSEGGERICTLSLEIIKPSQDFIAHLSQIRTQFDQDQNALEILRPGLQTI